MNDRELKRQRRVVDQSITMQAVLRDRYRRKATALTLGIMGGSVVMVAFAFAGTSGPVRMLGVEAQRTTWLGWLAVVVFFLSVVELKVDWASRSSRHGDAVHRLSSLKSAYRTASDAAGEESHQALLMRYDAVMSETPPVPDRAFVPLKSIHTRKRALSELLDEHPGASPRKLRRLLREQQKGDER